MKREPSDWGIQVLRESNKNPAFCLKLIDSNTFVSKKRLLKSNHFSTGLLQILISDEIIECT